jgi:ADP-ribosylglycohydrolase
LASQQSLKIAQRYRPKAIQPDKAKLSFKESSSDSAAVLKAVNFGEDRQLTTSRFTGGLAVIYKGMEAIPEAYLKVTMPSLARPDNILDLSKRLDCH